MDRYTAYFKDGSEFTLYGSDYFNDMPVFFRSHQTNLVSFSTEVAEKGRPVKVLDAYLNETITFSTNSGFDKWYVQNQSREFEFGFSDCETVKQAIAEALNRIDRMVAFLLSEIDALENEITFDPWRIDGGYKELENIVLTSIKSIENLKIKLIISANNSSKILEVFQVPLLASDSDEGLISFCKNGLSLSTENLMNKCKATLADITAKKSDLLQSLKA